MTCFQYGFRLKVCFSDYVLIFYYDLWFQEAGEGLKEPRKVLYEDKDVVSAVSYSLGENQDDKRSGNVGGTTDIAERTENGWCIVTGLCVVFFACCFLSHYLL